MAQNQDYSATSLTHAMITTEHRKAELTEAIAPQQGAITTTPEVPFDAMRDATEDTILGAKVTDEDSVVGTADAIEPYDASLDDEHYNEDSGSTAEYEQDAGGSAVQTTKSKPAEVLYCLEISERNKADRHYYKDTPWEGINTGLPGSEPDRDQDFDAVLMYYVFADVETRNEKESNTSKNWREKPVDFVFGRDAILKKRYKPEIKIQSKNLIKVIDTILDYWPGRGDHDLFPCEHIGESELFFHPMLCYAELKHYFRRYRDGLPEEEREDPRLALEDCGDEIIASKMEAHLNFGALDPDQNPCDAKTACDIAVLLRLLAGMYRAEAVPALAGIYPKDPEIAPRIKYAHTWILFRPGTVVYVKRSAFIDGLEAGLKRDELAKLERSKNWTGSRAKNPSPDDEYSACVVASWETDRRGWWSFDEERTMDQHLALRMWTVHWDGKAFQRIVRHAAIETYEGFKPLVELPVVPVHLYDELDGGNLRKGLEKRGNKYLSIVGVSAPIRTYSKPHSDDEGLIIIDPDAYRQNWGDPDDIDYPERIADGGAGVRLSRMKDFTPSRSGDAAKKHEGLILLPRRIEGFVLKTKAWKIFDTEYISESAPIPAENQLDSELILVSDADKESLRTVLPRREQSLASTPDFVAGKGEGKIFLLYGGPGTGKTLTVECVANDTRRPLLRLTAQDVGLSSNAEGELRRYFALAAKWDAILLIDEADLFLEQRKEGNIERNSLSTIFLRLMEYYKGVLFLTTNRPGHIDDSFISRITYPIEYPALSSETKAKLVEKFVRRFQDTETVVFNTAAKEYLKQNCGDLNGRQIRNTLQNAVASAEVSVRNSSRHTAQMDPMNAREPSVVTVKLGNVTAALERQTRFQKYLQNLRKKDETARARDKHDYLSSTPV